MQRTLASFIGTLLAISGASHACELAWPDAAIDIPPLVENFIASECRRYAGTSEETVGECREGERYGYRAVVGMLVDSEDGEKAAERYRACRAGLGDFGGRFHRRRAECMGSSFDVIWRFEFSREAELVVPGNIIEASNSSGVETPLPVTVTGRE